MKSEARATLSAFIRREIGGMAAQTWAQKVGLHPQDVRRALHGTTSMTLDKLQQFADVLGVEPWQMLQPGFERPLPAFPPMSVEAIDIAQRVDMFADEAQRRRAVAAVVNLLELAMSSAARPTPAPPAPTRLESDTTPKQLARQ